MSDRLCLKEEPHLDLEEAIAGLSRLESLSLSRKFSLFPRPQHGYRNQEQRDLCFHEEAFP